MVGLDIGSTTEYAGANERMPGLVPGLRYTTDNSNGMVLMRSSISAV